jgi:uncharacterized protein YejL (UPF0352 family)
MTTTTEEDQKRGELTTRVKQIIALLRTHDIKMDALTIMALTNMATICAHDHLPLPRYLQFVCQIWEKADEKQTEKIFGMIKEVIDKHALEGFAPTTTH